MENETSALPQKQIITYKECKSTASRQKVKQKLLKTIERKDANRKWKILEIGVSIHHQVLAFEGAKR